MNLEKFIEKNAPRNRIALLVIIDIFLITLSGFLALYIRYDFRFSQMDMRYVDYEILYLPVIPEKSRSSFGSLFPKSLSL